MRPSFTDYVDIMKRSWHNCYTTRHVPAKT